jgi:hypothetical protein
VIDQGLLKPEYESELRVGQQPQNGKNALLGFVRGDKDNVKL